MRYALIAVFALSMVAVAGCGSKDAKKEPTKTTAKPAPAKAATAPAPAAAPATSAKTSK